MYFHAKWLIGSTIQQGCQANTLSPTHVDHGVVALVTSSKIQIKDILYNRSQSVTNLYTLLANYTVN